MRSVNSATWTFVEPMSFSLAPNCPAISRLRSVVIAAIFGHGSRQPTASIRRPETSTGLSTVPCDLPRALHVAVHLLDQRLRRLEATLAAQAREEVEAQLAAIQIAVE